MANTKILYLETNKRNFIHNFLIGQQGYWLRNEDGKIDYQRRQFPDPPWIYVKPRENQQCHFWHKILFNHVFGKSKVPIACHNCWKVVLMPRNLEELMASYLMQLDLGLSCKCGTEGDRENTDRLYGAYFYNTTLEEGRACYETVKKTVESSKVWEKTLFGCPVKARFLTDGDTMPFSQGEVIVKGYPKVILKRGCTEFEQSVGPSDKWEAAPDQEETEWYANHSFVGDTMDFRQNEMQVANVLQKWIHNAFKWGDLSYLKFTNNNRLYNPPVTYHDQEEKKDG